MRAKISMPRAAIGIGEMMMAGKAGAAEATRRSGTGTAVTATAAGSAAKTEMLTGTDVIRNASQGVVHCLCPACRCCLTASHMPVLYCLDVQRNNTP